MCPLDESERDQNLKPHTLQIKRKTWRITRRQQSAKAGGHRSWKTLRSGNCARCLKVFQSITTTHLGVSFRPLPAHARGSVRPASLSKLSSTRTHIPFDTGDPAHGLWCGVCSQSLEICVQYWKQSRVLPDTVGTMMLY